MAAPTVLVTGGNGLLGSKLIAYLLGQDIAVVSASRGPCTNATLGGFHYLELDVTDAAGVERALDTVQPSVVIHAAAMTDVDGCEREPAACWRVNAEATAHLARACGRRDIRLVFLSTEYVFDGLDGPYTERDLPRPISVYGRSKLAGEEAVQRHCRSWAIARTTVVYGYARGARSNFVLWLLEQLASGRPVRVVADQVGSPTLADNLAEMVAALALSDLTGIFNTAGASIIDRAAFACLAAQVFALPAALIQRVTTAELGQLAPRPLRAGLAMDKFRQTFPDVPVLTARQGLEALRQQMMAGQLPGQCGGPPAKVDGLF